jgi:hypothetical protein
VCVCVCARARVYVYIYILKGLRLQVLVKSANLRTKLSDTESVYFVHLLPFPTITRGLLAVIISLAASLTSAGSGHASGGSGQMEVCTTVLLAAC